MPTGKRQRPPETDRPLPALLSQILVAFTLELDNEFERRMGEASYPGAWLSLVVWSNLMRFLVPHGLSVRELTARSLVPKGAVLFAVGCLERWIFVKLEADPADDRPIPQSMHRLAKRMLRDGWGSGRGIRPEWIVRPTVKGRKACEIWTPLPDEIEGRWRERFGADEIGTLRQSLEAVLEQIDFEMPQGLPVRIEAGYKYPGRGEFHSGLLSLPALLSQALLAFAVEFDRTSHVPLILCANTLRILGEQPIPLSEIPRLTGGSPETSDIGWELKPLAKVEPDAARSRGKVARLSPAGLRAQRRYRALGAEIEKRWEGRFGKDNLRHLRESLRELFVTRSGSRSLLAEGLVPAEGTIRAGVQAPALGRREIGAAARQRKKDAVAQTEMFLRDPAGTLPHYPMWDMNRGFGP